MDVSRKEQVSAQQYARQAVSGVVFVQEHGEMAFAKGFGHLPAKQLSDLYPGQYRPCPRALYTEIARLLE